MSIGKATIKLYLSLLHMEITWYLLQTPKKKKRKKENRNSYSYEISDSTTCLEQSQLISGGT